MRRTKTWIVAGLFAAVGCGDDGNGGDTGGRGSTSAATETGSATGDPTGPAGTDDPSGPADTTSGPGSTSAADTTTGPSDSSGDTGVAMCPDVGEPCTQCEATMCPQVYCDCFNNGSCGLLAQCALQCDIGDQACNQACWTMYPEGISHGALLSHCAATLCMPECGPFLPLTECQQCLYAQCQPQMNVCIANPDCTALLQCLDECTDPGCENGCYALYPGGLADSGPVGECAQDACLTECA